MCIVLKFVLLIYFTFVPISYPSLRPSVYLGCGKDRSSPSTEKHVHTLHDMDSTSFTTPCHLLETLALDPHA